MEEREFGRSGQHASVVGLGTWQLGADWGDVDEARRPGRARRGRRGGRHLLRHRRRLRRRPQRAAHRPLPGDRPDAGIMRRHQDGPPRRAGPRELRPGQLPRLDRPLAPQPRRRPLDLVQLHCPPTPVYSERRGVRRARHPRRGGRDRGVRRQRRDRRRGAHRDRPARTSRPCRSSSTRSGSSRSTRCCPRPREAGVGHHRPGAAGLRPAVREVHRGHHVRRRRPPHATTATARPSTQGETFSGVDYATGVEAAASSRPSPPRGTPRPRRRCAGSCSSPA